MNHHKVAKENFSPKELGAQRTGNSRTSSLQTTGREKEGRELPQRGRKIGVKVKSYFEVRKKGNGRLPCPKGGGGINIFACRTGKGRSYFEGKKGRQRISNHSGKKGLTRGGKHLTQIQKAELKRSLQRKKEKGRR